MRRVTVRLPDSLHAILTAELQEWRKVRGPKFSLNDLCSEKLYYAVPVTQWTIPTGTSSTNITFTQPMVMIPGPPPKEKKRGRQ